MKKKLLVLLLIGVLLVVNVTFAYMLTIFDTNQLTIKVGQPDEEVATLSEMQPGYVLIPWDSIATKSGETKKLDYRLIVESTMTRSYYISHNLPSQFTLTTDNTQGSFTTSRAYTISIVMNQPVTVNQVFYITIEFIS